MKKIILLLLFISPLFLNAQKHSLVKDYGVWGMMFSHFEPDDPPSSTTNFIYYIMYGDTLISNIDYKKIYVGLYKDTINTQYYMGAMREDSLGDVYFRCSNDQFNCSIYNDTLEHLLYSFSLQDGDTLFGVNPYYPLIVKKIDSVLINGEYRKKIIFYNYTLGNREWIEGIGSVSGLFYPAKVLPGEFSQQLICYTDSNITWPSNVNCNGLGIKENPRNNNLYVYPNPSSEFTYINFGNNTKTDLDFYIFNGLGIKIKTFKISKNSKQYKLDLRNLNPGIYFFQIVSQEGKIEYSGKLMKL